MAKHGKNSAGFEVSRLGPALIALCLMAACVGSNVGGKETPSMLSSTAADLPEAAHGAARSQLIASQLIAGLMARKSVLPAGGPYDRVAGAVMAASAGVAEAELRVAQLKAEARSKNWLPSIGPSVNLTSLSSVAASLMLEQPLFDNGRRKAERDYAAADVEVAAATLSTAQNLRVFSGLSYYVEAERARAQAAISHNAGQKLQEFAGIMSKRVAGGLSDRSEQQVLAQKLAEMQATLSADQQTEAAALADLGALTAGALGEVHGLDSLTAVEPGLAEPLSVIKARGEGARTNAQAQMQIADLKPGIKASAGLSQDGVAPGVRLSGGTLLSPGSKSDMEALRQTPDLVDRQTAEAAESANRKLISLQTKRATLLARQSSGAEVVRQTADNLDLFTRQYKVGRRTLLELVSQYDSFARLQRDQASLAYEIALTELEMARDLGVLVDGARM